MTTPLTTLDHLAIQARDDRAAADRLYVEVQTILQQEIATAGRLDPIEAESEANLSFIKAVANFEEGRAPFEQFLRFRVRFDLREFMRRRPGGSRGPGRAASLEGRWGANSGGVDGRSGLARDLIPDDAPSAAEEAEANELRAAVASLIAALPHNHWRTVATLLWVEGRSPKEAAAELGYEMDRFWGVRKATLQGLRDLIHEGTPFADMEALLA